MQTKKYLLLTACCFVFLFSNSQDYANQFKKLGEKDDTSGQIKLLRNWETASPKDPDMFIAYFNYYANMSMHEVVSIERDKKTARGFEVTDSASGEPVAYINSSVKFRSGILQKGFDYIDKGLALYPTRLDMRFGKCYMLGQAENYRAFANYIVETIDYGNSIKDKWTWEHGKPLDDAKNFFLGSMQDYIKTLYDTENDNLLPLMRQISEAVLKYNPTHVESLDNVALTYLLTGEHDKALKYLLDAEKVAPKDIIVLNNIAQTYKRKNDKPNAKLYFEKIIKLGDKEEKEGAKEEIKKLGN